MIQVLVDADNLPVARLRLLLRALPLDEVALVVAGSPRALAVIDWPAAARVVAVEGWQRADWLLAEAYMPGVAPLVLASGDSDFAGIVRGHAGPVLVVSDRPARMLRDAAPVLDPAVDGLEALRGWFDAVLDAPWRG